MVSWREAIMHRVRLGPLVRAVLWTGLVSIGGGRSAYFHESLVARHRWLTTTEFLQDLTLSQLLPGPNVTNFTVAIGYRLAGLAGSACAWVAIILPGAVILFFLTLIYFTIGLNVHLVGALRGMSAAVVGLMLVTNARLLRGLRRSRGAGWVAAATFLAVAIVGVNTVAVVVVMATVSLWANRPRSATVTARPLEDTMG
jgi:chromate transporter